MTSPIEHEDKRTELMREIRDELWHFRESPLYAERVRNRVYPVVGEGSHHASIMFVGEAPGKTEAQTGRPFSGAAGNVLDKLLASIGVDRKDVYVTNIVKDRPTENRDPLPEEIALYGPFLNRQIDIIKPSVIAMLGRHSMRYILDCFGHEQENGTISKIHGNVYEGTASYGTVKLVPLYHPATALYRAELLPELEKDFQVLKEFIKT